VTDPLTVLALEALVMSWPEGLHVDPASGRGSCIETTLIVSRVLTRMEVEHRPMPCQVWLANARGREFADAGLPVADWPEDAYSVGVDPDMAVTQASTSEPYSLNGFAGHLAVAGSDWILDLTVQQFARPDKGIVVDGGLLVDGLPIDPTADEAQMIVGDLRGGGVIRYITRNELASWRRTPAWRQDVEPGLIEAVCESMIDSLAGR